MLVGIGMHVLATAFGEAPTAIRLGSDAPVNASAALAGDLTSHNSPTIVRNPKDADVLAVANRIDTPAFSCALHVSDDGGSTWRQVAIPIPRGAPPKCYAPDAAFGADGTLHVSFVTLRGQGNEPDAAWLTSSEDGGTTLSEPTRILGPLAFQVRLVADPVVPRRLYLTWLEATEVGLFRFSQPGNPIRFKRSDDGGSSWGRAVRVSGATRSRAVAASLAVGGGGTLYALYLDLGDDRLNYEGAHEGEGGAPFEGRWRLVLSRSTNGGAVWEERVVDDGIVPTERFIAFIPPYPSIAAHGDRVYATFHDGRLGDPDVWLWSSPNRGRTFRPPVRVNDTPRRDGTSQYLPKVTVAPGGRVDVLYYDRRDDRGNRENDVSLQSSFDHGASFARRVKLSGRAFDSRVGFGSERGMPDLGSRLGLVSTDRAALAVWTDTRAGTQASGKQDIAAALVAFSEPARIPRGLELLLTVGGIALAAGGGVLLLATLVARRRRPAA